MPKRRRNSFIPSPLGGEDIGQTERSSGPSVADHQQQTNEKCAKMEIELRDTKKKQREMIDELKALKEKVAKMEEQKEVSIVKFKKWRKRIGELGERQKQKEEKVAQTMAVQIAQLADERKKYKRKCDELENQLKQQHQQEKEKGNNEGNGIGKTEKSCGTSSADHQQQQKQFVQMFNAKKEMELINSEQRRLISKLQIENRAFGEELKHQKMISFALELENNKMMMEKKQKQKEEMAKAEYVTAGQIEHLQNDRKKISGPQQQNEKGKYSKRIQLF
ncbi:hypothetical protein niasHS_004581 [Heterodera schachtii]|uniref:Uncharacterized protein n=1 Tax=Heterodera schachtii TaxID=97005 RepID=A0ABD2JR78_HETSC